MIQRRKVERAGEKVPVVCLLKSLLLAYVLTAVLLLLLAFLVYRMGLTEGIVSIVIIFVYILSCFIAGFTAGKQIGVKKYVWGFVLGGTYFLVLMCVSLMVNHSLKDVSTNFFTVFVLCTGSGMLGGMVS